MYNNSYEYSGLITGAQWDVTLNKIVEKNLLKIADITSSNKWGNYRDTQLTYTGRLAKAYYKSSGGWFLPKFGIANVNAKTSIYNSNNTYGELLTTGACSATEKYHIFDLAGNLLEWTNEMSKYSSTNTYYIARGRIICLFIR